MTEEYTTYELVTWTLVFMLLLLMLCTLVSAYYTCKLNKWKNMLIYISIESLL